MTEKYRKKPVEVEVIRFDRGKWNKEISQAKLSETYPMVLLSIIGGIYPVIVTLEGDMKVSDGDYINKGVQGEFYACKPDIFHETYEPVTDHQPDLNIKNNNDNPTPWGQIMSDHQQTFEVGEYYASKTGIVFKIISKTTKEEIAAVKSLVDGEIIDGMIDTTEIMFRYSKPATAEQIAEFKRAEHFAAHGRKLDEFGVGDKVLVDNAKLGTIFQIKNGTIDAKISGFRLPIICLEPEGLTLIQTAEELREVSNNGN